MGWAHGCSMGLDFSLPSSEAIDVLIRVKADIGVFGPVGAA